MEILKGNILLDTKEESVISNEIIKESKYIGLYFSASWCPPCQSFLPLLKNVYEEAHNRNIKFEIIFVPSDSDNQTMTRYFVNNHGSWYAVASGSLAANLRKKMQIFAIPQLVILSNKGKVITKNGRFELETSTDPLTLWFPNSTNDFQTEDNSLK